VRLQYDTVITFEGRLYMVKSDSDHSRGFDLSVFSEFISGYNLFMRNNALGGITLSTDDAFNISSGAQAVASNLFGVGKTDGSFNVFNAFLEKIGDVSIVQKPIISTTSGVPGYFSKFERQYYNTVSQQTASGGTGSAVVGTTNKLVPVEFGTLLRINPRYDVDTELVRAQLVLSQKFLSGFQQTTQQISAGDKVVDVPVTIPLLTQSTYEGETIMRNGDLIILGGQIEQESQKEEQGVPIVKDFAGIGDFFGTGVKSSSNLTYYFALTVKIEKM
jgi:type II secretory pathway component GspD/PulD (secretin)